MAITIIGLPWARAAFNIALYTLLPFGQKAVSRDAVHRAEDIGTGLLGVHRQLHLAGAGRLVAGARTSDHRASCSRVTIVGIPFAWAHLKLAGIALWPIGKMIVPA